MEQQMRRRLVGESRFGRKKTARGKNGIAVSSHPIVSQIAVDTLNAGGNAVDAVMAASVAQTVVEPHMTTICGMLSMLHYDAATGEASYLNGGINRPKELTHLAPTELRTGKSVGVPGFWAAVESALERLGSKPKSELLKPAIDLAREGFEVNHFLYGMAFEQIGSLGRYPEGRNVFFPEGRLIEVGEILRQPDLADTLERLIDDGAEYFYRGEFAKRMVETVQNAGGVLTLDDLDRYAVRWGDPARSTYRDYDVLGSPPPDAGGTHVIEILNLLELIPLERWGPSTESPDTLYWMLRFCGEVYAEGAKIRDPEFFDVPLDLLVSKSYAQQRFELMRMADPQPVAKPPYSGSNHLTVVDGDGNIATVLHSVMSQPWTNGLFVDGVQLWAGAEHFLRTMPPAGGRGTSYLAPTLLLRQGKPVLAAGSPGHGLIQNVVQNTVNILDFGLDIEQSVHRPRFGALSVDTFLADPVGPPSYLIEADLDEAVRAEVVSRGIRLDACNPWNFYMGSYEGVHLAEDGTMSACADPRRAGKAIAV
ncbi:gamma-glutamyltransferase family protein [Nesterenkonia ebinurensis]|uniref:gamma-glutamyltransferase family protein n=1 Tax=Nesterenkonia ebinurensis TaxID=2608252 RepID=UPI00168B79CE|nr:gamma-glutamyltransferase [Nesterenkonia ebinurensis]